MLYIFHIFNHVIFQISKLRSAESCPDVSHRCNSCPLCQRPLSFAYVALKCKIRSPKAHKSCVCEFAMLGQRLYDCILWNIYSFGNLVSCGNVANYKEHKLMLHPPFSHSDHLVIKVQITIWAPIPFYNNSLNEDIH